MKKEQFIKEFKSELLELKSYIAEADRQATGRPIPLSDMLAAIVYFYGGFAAYVGNVVILQKLINYLNPYSMPPLVSELVRFMPAVIATIGIGVATFMVGLSIATICKFTVIMPKDSLTESVEAGHITKI